MIARQKFKFLSNLKKSLNHLIPDVTLTTLSLIYGCEATVGLNRCTYSQLHCHLAKSVFFPSFYLNISIHAGVRVGNKFLVLKTLNHPIVLIMQVPYLGASFGVIYVLVKPSVSNHQSFLSVFSIILLVNVTFSTILVLGRLMQSFPKQQIQMIRLASLHSIDVCLVCKISILLACLGLPSFLIYPIFSILTYA